MACYTSQQNYHTFCPYLNPPPPHTHTPKLPKCINQSYSKLSSHPPPDKIIINYGSSTSKQEDPSIPHPQTRCKPMVNLPLTKLTPNARPSTTKCSPLHYQMLAPPLPNKAPCTDLQGLPTQLTKNNGPRPSPVQGKWILRHGDLCLVAGSLKASSTGAASSSGASGQVMATHWRSLILMCLSWCQICAMQKQALSDLASLYSTLRSYFITCGRWAL